MSEKQEAPLYACKTCGRGVIFQQRKTYDVTIRACPTACENDPIVANASATVYGVGGARAGVR